MAAADAEMAEAGSGMGEGTISLAGRVLLEVDARTDHDAIMRSRLPLDPEAVRDRAKSVKSVVPSDLHNLNRANLRKSYELIAIAVGNRDVDQDHLQQFLAEWSAMPHKSMTQVLEICKDGIQSGMAMQKRQAMRDQLAHEEAAGRFSDRKSEVVESRISKVKPSDFQVCPQLVQVIHIVDNMGKLNTLGARSGYHVAMEKQERLIEQHFKEIGEAPLRKEQREKMYLGDYGDWPMFCEEYLKALPEAVINETLVRRWLRGQKVLLKYAPVRGGVGPAVWREMLKKAGLPYEPFNVRSKSKNVKNAAKPPPKWSPDHIEMVSTLSTDRSNNAVANQPYNFGIIYFLAQNKRVHRCNANELAKMAYWGGNVIARVMESTRHYYRQVANAADVALNERLENGLVKFVPLAYEHSSGKTEKAFLLPALARETRTSKPSKKAAEASQAGLTAFGFRAAASAQAGPSDAASDAESDDDDESDAEFDDGVDEDTTPAAGADAPNTPSTEVAKPSTPPGSPSTPPPPASERSNAAGKRSMAPVTEPARSSGEASVSAESEEEEEEEEEEEAPVAKKRKTDTAATAAPPVAWTHASLFAAALEKTNALKNGGGLRRSLRKMFEEGTISSIVRTMGADGKESSGSTVTVPMVPLFDQDGAVNPNWSRDMVARVLETDSGLMTRKSSTLAEGTRFNGSNNYTQNAINTVAELLGQELFRRPPSRSAPSMAAKRRQ